MQLRISAYPFLSTFIAGLTFGIFSNCTTVAAQAPMPAGNYIPRFAGIHWRMPIDDVRLTMMKRGFVIDAKRTGADTDGDLWFTGKLHGEPAWVIAFFDQQRRLIKTQINIITPDAECISTYTRAINELRNSYGAPDIALRKTVMWTGSADNAYAVYVRVLHNLTVEVAYESDAWAAELLRRQSLAGKFMTPDIALR